MSTSQAHVPPILIAGHPALDFVNTWAKPDGVEKDWLADGQGLLSWLTEAGLCDAGALASLAANHTATELDAIASEARRLRQWFRGLIEKQVGTPFAADNVKSLAPINDLLQQDHSFRQLTLRENTLAWSRGRHPLSPKLMLLLPIAEQIGDLLTQEDCSLVRFCEGKGCVLVFLDQTKSHARRWCSMGACGNRSKAAAHRARSAGR